MSNAYLFNHFFLLLLDVHQFTIITELLGTPPDDVIATICSENVKRKKKSITILTLFLS